MNASDLISGEFNRLLEFGHTRMHERSFAEQVIYYLVIARCEKDTSNFISIFEQGLTKKELEILIEGLREIDEPILAHEFTRALALLNREGFYPGLDKELSAAAEAEIEDISDRIGDRLWDLDEKLTTLLNANAA